MSNTVNIESLNSFILPDGLDRSSHIECMHIESPSYIQSQSCDASPSSIQDIGYIENSNTIDKSDKLVKFNYLNAVGDAMVYTKQGLYKICDLINKEVEIWSGSRWFRVIISISRGNHKQNYIQKITLCNGLCLKCVDSQNWLVVDNNKIITVSTNDLEIDMRIPTFQMPTELEGDIVKNAYDIGKQIGKLFILKQHIILNSHIRLPSQIYKFCTHSLGRFVAGWIDSQNGHIYGNYNVIHDLQLLLLRLHINISYIIKKNTYYTLEIPDKHNIPNPNNQMRESNPHIKNNKLYINSVETIQSTQKIYSIQNLDSKTKTIVLDGVLAII